MSMHEQTRKFLEDISGFPPLHLLSPEEIRKVVVATAISDNFELAGTEDRQLQGPHGAFAVRIYRPTDEKKLPVILFFHGGGFVFNRMEHFDPMCSKLAAATGYAVVSVDYHLAPEHKFPVPVDEAMFAAKWVHENAASLGLDPGNLSVAGESVGANLAAVVAQLARNQGGPAITMQILLCPLTDWSGDHESMRTYGTGYFLTSALLDYCAGHYLNDEADKCNPLASPLLGDVAGLPPALIVTAEYDPLRDEGERYGQKLIENGVKVTSKRYPGMIHLFYAMTDVFDDGNDVYDLIRQELQKAH
ncbi:alpha/beta hydrolase fold domain-containing protein [Paenibacillus allorhizosphaerae]|uniref:Acetyl esterase n=1 Tax=Paenibacillus allorhizosphaerae TaxID=2849866 RepID=A0ABN7TJA7_9BACL|nr:alpha/beta hydrolase [Paenibacillus allorhizosphaerae]CAG7637051.1 Acetyl esterase [Paenibacillus allorhizosphaerae]